MLSMFFTIMRTLAVFTAGHSFFTMPILAAVCTVLAFAILAAIRTFAILAAFCTLAILAATCLGG